jgi:hypothetical protein
MYQKCRDNECALHHVFSMNILHEACFSNLAQTLNDVRKKSHGIYYTLPLLCANIEE